MLNVAGFTTSEQLHLGNRAMVFRARRQADGLPVVLKAPRNPHPEPFDVARLKTEYRLGQMVNHPNVIRYLDLAQDEHRPVLVIEDFGGAALSRTLAGTPLTVERFLELAIALADGLAALHKHGIIHRDINPANIIYDAASKQVKIADLGIGALFAHSSQNVAPPPTQIEGTLRYISPEQTGRVSRSVDQRTDLYSLGVTFYEMLAGQVPFTAHDPLELVHAHLARTAQPLVALVDGLPTTVSAIVGKLLTKAPEERYQSANGLAVDLRQCREQLRNRQEIEEFRLAAHDASARFALPERLYGRDAELQQFMAAFERARDGGRMLLSVVGPSGSGKTALLHEAQRAVLERGGWFVRSRFDAGKQSTPHAAFAEVGAELVKTLLTGNEEHVNSFRDSLQQALGEAGQILIDVIPEVELLIGPQPPAPELPHAESSLRFHRLACTFFRLFASPRHALVVLLDDLQWADAASLKLIELLMAAPELHHLLLVGSFRADEVTPSHPLALTLKAVDSGPAETDRIDLPALQARHLGLLLADTLATSADAVQPLAATLHKQTLGNPLFVTQYLRTLHSEGLLRFNENIHTWEWDADAIAARDVTDDVADLLLARMKRLPQTTRDVLEIAACAGRRFDIATLSGLAELPVGRTAVTLRPAVEANVIRACCSSFGRLIASLAADNDSVDVETFPRPICCEFAHSRFQQAIYARIPATRRQDLHLRLGRKLLASLSKEALTERVFEVVQHFQSAGEALQDRAERLDVARLCLAAGNKALDSVAYAAAQHHFAAGVALLPADRWQQHYELCFELMVQLYSTKVMTRAQGAEALLLGQELLEHARTRTDRLRATAEHVVILARMHRTDDALEIGTALLREVGVELQPADLPRAIEQGHLELEALLGERDVADLAGLPPMTDPEMLATQTLLGSISLTLFMRHRELLPLQTMANVRLALAHGNAPMSAMAYAAWGRVLAHTFGDYKRGYDFCRMGRQLADSMGAFRAGTWTFSYLTSWVRDPLSEIVDGMRRTYRLGIETGELNFSALSAAILPTIGFCAGIPLEALREESKSYLDFIHKHQGDVGVREVDITLRVIDALLGRRAPENLFDSPQQTREAIEVMRERNREALVWFHQQRTRLELLFGEPREALQHAELGYALVDWRMGAFASHDLTFLYAMAVARCLDQSPAPDTEALTLRFEQLAAQLQRWVDAGAGKNLRHKALLTAAELLRMRGDRADAGPAYERAIEAATASSVVQDQAMANELTARYYAENGLTKVAQVYVQESYYCYQKWGATAKLRALQRQHPFLGHATGEVATVTHVPSPSAQTTTRTTTADRAPVLDYGTVIEAARAMSGEVVLGNLLRKLLAIAAENAGAERALLLLRQGTSLTIHAAWQASNGDVRLMDGVLLDAFEDIAAGIANYVSRTREAVVLSDAARAGRFQTDPYVTGRRPRSLLCAPLTNQGRLVGLLYLENNLVTGAFTDARLELVQLLCSQAAISIDNASLYGDLEQKVEKRTRDLARKNEQLNESLDRERQMQHQLLISEKMASLGNLVAGVAHELNTPIGAVVASVDTATRALEKMRQALSSAQTLEQLQQGRQVNRLIGLLDENHQLIRTAGERVSEIVRTLRNFARLDEAERKLADLHEGLDSTLELLHHRLKHGIKVVKQYSDLPQVLCYPNQLNQVFMNLLVNAIDAVSLDPEKPADRRTIRIRTWADNKTAHVAVSDTGPGIPISEQPRIFDPGYTTKGVGVGTGLGLSICFSIVDKHAGTIALESEPGEGATFTVTIPI